MYGGLIIGFGAIQWRGYRSMAFRSAAIEATGWIFAGVALGRLAGLLDGALAGLQPVFLLGEVCLALATRFAVHHAPIKFLSTALASPTRRPWC